MSEYYKNGEEKFGRISTWFYSHFSRFFVRELHRVAFEEITRRIDQNVKSVLDIGCGPGSLTLKIAKNAPEVRVYGIDPSPYMIKEANKIAQKNVKFELGSSTLLPPLNFDLIYTVLSFHHWANQEDSLEKIYEHLSGNVFLVFEYNKDSPLFHLNSHSMSKKQFESLKSPFQKLEVRTIGRVVEAIFYKL
ncbi:hypothetical protein B9Q02_06050 [Candidatus Marsarchaeota G1 archaeon BE_D]|uniref:Methyltransferase domain-containing protein n=1 Tax=Candidatus Marsarchaeota G1 archaeon BE_D TaxID=1978156 RepID=A0A2R6AGN5_9ARCH|nr:MAG: hypothetical protein B9Q02_06050 [Candidatus Marsarchaeota G1 archaeon BE_D]